MISLNPFYTTIPGTRLKISPLGLGTVKFGRNTAVKYPKSFDLPTKEELADLLAFIKERGINLLDTAPAYGNSEEIIGQLIKQQRTDWIISTKVGEEYIENRSFFDFSQVYVHKSIDRSLTRLGTDYLDIVFIHSNGQDTDIINQTDILPKLLRLKECGKIRHIGMSTKTVEGGLLALQFCDVLMVEYNQTDTSQIPVIQAAQAQHKGIFIKKALQSGHFKSEGHSLHESLSFVLDRNISSIVVGSINPKHILENIENIVSILDK